MMVMRPGRLRVALVTSAAFILVLCSRLFFVSYEIEIPGYDKLDPTMYPDLGITMAEEFPADGPYRIEKIIHQTWKSTDIPQHYVKWIKTWTKNHPDWKYMFWTDESARKLIADKYSNLLPAYDSYLENIRRADAMRYVILYEYGGIYVDLDMESLRPLNSIVRKYSCILPQEPYEHPIIDSNFEHLVINAFMACKKGHPLMKTFHENLPKFSHMWNLLDSTGPHYITLLYREYIQTKFDPTSDDGVYLAPAEYFFPTIDPVKFSYMVERCYKNFDKMSHIQKTACISLKRRGLERNPYPFSFANHHWDHTYFMSRITLQGPTSIFDIVPHVEIYA